MSAHETNAIRLQYVYARKSFLNEKSFDIFKWYNVAVFGYIAYLVTAFRTVAISAESVELGEALLYIGKLTIGAFLVMFLVVMSLNVFQWLRYEKEENAIRKQEPTGVWTKLFSWFEFWMVIAGTLEAMLALYITTESYSVFSSLANR